METDLHKQKGIAIEMKNNIYFDPADCRNIVIQTPSLCVAAEAVDVLEKALKLFHDLPEERITDFVPEEPPSK